MFKVPSTIIAPPLNIGLPIDIKQIKIDVEAEQRALDALNAIVSKCAVGTHENGNLIINDISKFEEIKNLTVLAFSTGISIHQEPTITFDNDFKQGTITFSEPVNDTVNYKVYNIETLGNANTDGTVL